jgi:hypothetical protein
MQKVIRSEKHNRVQTKIQRTLGYWNGFILVPFGQDIYFCQIEDKISKREWVVEQADQYGYEKTI